MLLFQTLKTGGANQLFFFLQAKIERAAKNTSEDNHWFPGTCILTFTVLTRNIL